MARCSFLAAWLPILALLFIAFVTSSAIRPESDGGQPGAPEQPPAVLVSVGLNTNICASRLCTPCISIMEADTCAHCVQQAEGGC